MRILGITETCDLGSLYLRLIVNGHEVRVSVSEPLARGTMAGLVPKTEDWESELSWIAEAGDEGVILFEAAGFGALQDQLRERGYNVIGGSAFGDRLENDRGFAQRLLATLGMRIAPVREFTSAEGALVDLASRPRRCVFKKNASAGDTFVGAFDDGRDVAALLRTKTNSTSFVLMDYISGVEVGVGAYFNGNHFLRPACLDWEHKRFFPGDMGELTGEMGTVATFDGSDRLFELSLKRLEPALRAARHVGYVNLNLIVTEHHLWPLEFTSRFGYPGFAVLEPLQELGWAELFRLLLDRESAALPVGTGFSLCVVLTTPPFPWSRHEVDVPVGLPLDLGVAEPNHVHLGEVGLDEGELVTSGLYGWTVVVTGTGHTVEDAQTAAYYQARQVQTTNMRYRTDIGQKLISGDLLKLAEWGWLKSMPERMASQMVR
jgi:phosphoribosylamine--glycine ligase